MPFFWGDRRGHKLDSLFGPYLGLIPAVLVTVFDEPFRALLCCVVVLVVQQLDGNVIYPNVIGKSLAIHPLTIILVLLVAGNLAGLLGIFLEYRFTQFVGRSWSLLFVSSKMTKSRKIKNG